MPGPCARQRGWTSPLLPGLCAERPLHPVASTPQPPPHSLLLGSIITVLGGLVLEALGLAGERLPPEDLRASQATPSGRPSAVLNPPGCWEVPGALSESCSEPED